MEGDVMMKMLSNGARLGVIPFLLCLSVGKNDPKLCVVRGEMVSCDENGKEVIVCR